MKLRDLDAKLIRHEQRDGRQYHIEVESITEAHGVMFLCPACYRVNNGPAGTHAVICWSRSRGVPDEVQPGPGRWRLDGTGLDDLTLNAEQPGGARSVQLNGGCSWHGFVTNGAAV
jgi:hypothetical protein